MKNHVKLTQHAFRLTAISFVCTLILHYKGAGDEAEFWCNFCLAIFGSSLLTLITAFIGYFEEKRHIMEGFCYSTNSLLDVISTYDSSWGLEKKIDFFMNYIKIDKSQWDGFLGSMYFMFDFDKKTKGYIYNLIYKPIMDFNFEVNKHRFHFIWYKDGSGKNDIALTKFIEEIESTFIEEIQITSSGYDGKDVTTTYKRNKLVESVLAELYGTYNKIIYDYK